MTNLSSCTIPSAPTETKIKNFKNMLFSNLLFFIHFFFSKKIHIYTKTINYCLEFLILLKNKEISLILSYKNIIHSLPIFEVSPFYIVIFSGFKFLPLLNWVSIWIEMIVAILANDSRAEISIIKLCLNSFNLSSLFKEVFDIILKFLQGCNNLLFLLN